MKLAACGVAPAPGRPARAFSRPRDNARAGRPGAGATPHAANFTEATSCLWLQHTPAAFHICMKFASKTYLCKLFCRAAATQGAAAHKNAACPAFGACRKTFPFPAGSAKECLTAPSAFRCGAGRNPETLRPQAKTQGRHKSFRVLPGRQGWQGGRRAPQPRGTSRAS